ncbi:MAG: hypothetical protein WCX65_14315 [bacterium]
MDYTGVAQGVTGQSIVNQAETTFVKKSAPKEIETAPTSAPAQDVANAAGLSEKLKTYAILMSDSTENDVLAQKNELPSPVANLIGQHPLYPFDRNFMDVTEEFAKRVVSGDVKVTPQMLEPVKTQIGQVKSEIVEKAVDAEAATEAAEKPGVKANIIEVI